MNQELNLAVGKAAYASKTGEDILNHAKEISEQYNRKVGTIVTNIYKFRKKAGIAPIRKRRSDAKTYEVKNEIVVVNEPKKPKAVIHSPIKLDFTPSRVEVCKDHIRLYF